MSTFEIIHNEAGEPSKGYVRGATLCYIKLQEGALKYGSKTEKEYVLDAVVDKTTAKAWKKMFSKNTPKEVDTSEFEAKYKIPAPFPEQDEQYVVKFKAKAQLTKDIEKANLKAGDDIPYEWSTRPKLFIKGSSGVKDVTMSVLAANGSVGDISFNISSNDFGTFPKLTAVLVTDLIEYEAKDGGTNASPFGEVEGGFNAGNGETMQKATPTTEPDEFNPYDDAAPNNSFDNDIDF